MGFSISQAKKALAATANGQDVQAALESLLSGDINGQSPPPSSIQAPQARATPPPPPPPPSSSSHRSNVRAPPKGQKERERERKERESQRIRREDTSGAGSTTAADIQDQADKLLSQASEIGLSVLSRASAFWKEGKEKVVKVIEERSGGVGTGGGGGGGGFEERGRGKNVDGRPKWMNEVVVDHDDEGDGFGEGFKDAGVGEDIDVPVPHEPTVNLFALDPVTSQQQRPSPSQRPSPTQRPSQTRTRTHSHHPSRTLPTTSSSTLSLAFTHKNNGTSQFKLGQYGLASESYTSAITLLPPGHLLLVPLYTNRSLSRLKCGEHVGAGEDAGEALNIICVVDSNIDPNSNLSNGKGKGNVLWSPDTELPELIQGGRDKVNQGGWLDPRGVGVDLIDGYIKALRRRAEAWEGREKWIEAGRDWEVLAGGGGGVGKGWIGESIRQEAVRGAGRCRKMISASGQEGVSSSTLKPLSKSKSKQTPDRPSSSQPSKALLAHQATTLQAEADDTLKHQLKDSVDTRISAWKKGKETNIRALLSSLDMVLWREILSGGVKVNGLGELVTDVQVKKGYMRAIAKVHPDKVKLPQLFLSLFFFYLFRLLIYNFDKFNATNSTVEQRMLANSVFAALNEAWIAFQGGK
jgi:hypothetical protein